MNPQNAVQGLAGLGRYGDSTLVHMQPHEVAGLQSLAQSQGTSLTINPETGLPEAFNLGGFFRSLAPTLAGFGIAMIPGMQPYALQAGIAAGALTGAALNKKDPLMGAVMGGIGGYGGQGLAGAASSFGKQAVQAGVEPSIGAVQSGFNAIPTNVGANMANPSAAFTGSTGQMGVNMGATNMVKPVTYNTASTGFGSYSPHLEGAIRPDLFPEVAKPSALAQQASGFADNASNAFSNVAANPMEFVKDNAFKIGAPLAMATMEGMMPELRPMGQNPNDKYDPDRTLNLNTYTGLKFEPNLNTYAQGGPVSFADGGDALKGGGADALKGSSLMPLDVSDINAKYGYDPEASSSGAQPWGGSGLWGSYNTWGARSSMPSVAVPQLGLFADNDQIEAARTAYETQLAAAMSGRGGMGSTSNAEQLGRSMGAISGGPMATQTTGLAGLGTMGSTAATAPTASTAETALSRLNLNKQYAQGGTIQGGGLQDLYGSSDNVTPPQLSQDGYGLGRLQAMAQGGAMGFAEGGAMQGGGSGAMQGGNLNLNSATGLGNARLADTGAQVQYQPHVSAFLNNNNAMSTHGYDNGFYQPHVSAFLNGPPNAMAGYGYAKGGYLDGPGDGMSDSIPATIEGKQPERLSDGELFIPADVVSHLGNGSTKAGSQRLYGMLDKVRKARTGTKKQGKQINPNKYMPA